MLRLQNATCAGKSAMARVPVTPSRRPIRCRKQARLIPQAVLGGGDKEDKKVLTREAEPEEYWSSKSERPGANPLADPLAIIGILAILFPFALLGIAIATGLIDTSVYR